MILIKDSVAMSNLQDLSLMVIIIYIFVLLGMNTDTFDRLIFIEPLDCQLK